MPEADPVTPIIILVEPQLAENIGMAARAMANFGLSDLRLVAPPSGWPRKGAHAAASGASHILEQAQLHATAREAIADLHFVLAATARERDQMKQVLGPAPAIVETRRRLADGQKVGFLFGRERAGLDNDEVSLADAIVTFPVDRRFPSLNLAQAVLVVSYEWHRHAAGAALRFGAAVPSLPAARETLMSFLDDLERELDERRHFPPDKRSVMVRNMRDIFHRMRATEQDIRTLRGIVRALARRPPLRRDE